MTGSEGHLFVVLGRIESVVHDVALIPTSDRFKVRDYWWPLTGEDFERHRPTRLVVDGHAPSPIDPGLWFVSVGADAANRLAILADRMYEAIHSIVRRGLRAGVNRAKPLIAVPILGIEGGGLGGHKGTVIKQQLLTCAQLAAELGVDIAIVTPDRAAYGAAQHLRTKGGGYFDGRLSSSELVEAKRVGALAREGQLALFLGAGVSVSAGLPGWGELVDELSGGGLVGEVSGLSALDQAQIIELRSMPGELGQHVARIISRADRPGISHALLAALGAKEVVTTNYDRLYEKSVAAVDERTAVVMPFEAALADRPWILKLHGDLEHPEKIVLTRRHFVRFDALTRPAGSLLQSLLMTRHLLIVGVSLNDDNVVRLAHEVQAYREEYGLSGTFGTLLDLEGHRLREELWRGQLQWLTLGGTDLSARARTLEIFLDATAAFASSNQAWLLDRRFKDLLTAEEERVADAARRLYAKIPPNSQTWRDLRANLEDLGAVSAYIPAEERRRRRRS